MTKKQIEQLVFQSYTKDSLDLKKMQKYILGLSRRDLKRYIRIIKNWEKKQSVEVITPSENYKKNVNEKMIKALFSKRNVKYTTDTSIIAGVKIINDDIVYNFNLKDTLESIMENIEKQYD